MKIFLTFYLFFLFAANAVILPEVEWELPSDWQVINTELAESPWIIVPSEGIRISVFRYENVSSAQWKLVKSWADKLKIEDLTEEDLDGSLTSLPNGLELIKLDSEMDVVHGGFFVLHDVLWVFKASGRSNVMRSFDKELIAFFGTIAPGKALQKYIASLQEGALGGNINSQIELAELYLDARGVPFDPIIASKYLEKARSQGAAEATFRLGVLAIKQGQLNEAIGLLEEACDRKHIGALKKMAGLMLELKKDVKRAMDYLQKAAELGDADAMFYLGNIYANDERFKDDAKAVQWISAAAAKGHVDSLYALAQFYRNGFGVSKNSERAREYLEQSAAKNHVPSLELIGSMWVEGELGKADYKKALQYLVKATMEGSSSALIDIADLYLQGNGVNKNIVEAMKLYEEAARRNQTEAMNRLGDLYTQGKDVPQDYEKAYEWYLKSGSVGDVNGMFGLSLALFSGKGVEKNQLEAVKWMKLAAARGHTVAEKMLRDTGFED